MRPLGAVEVRMPLMRWAYGLGHEGQDSPPRNISSRSSGRGPAKAGLVCVNRRTVCVRDVRHRPVEVVYSVRACARASPVRGRQARGRLSAGCAGADCLCRCLRSGYSDAGIIEQGVVSGQSSKNEAELGGRGVGARSDCN